LLNFGDIGAGQTATSTGNFGVTISNLPLIHTFTFYIEILSNYNPYWSDTTDVIAGISGTDENIPAEFSLRQNYPNPFNPSTTIEFSLPKTEFVSLKVFEVNGKQVADLVSSSINAGTYRYDWNAEHLSSGIYYYTLQAGDFKQTRKLVLLK